ncbi:hypothetical protein PY650_08290 [Rhizobium calliandrae]|uniref:Transposase n=1 Tax=Rhizobium calliandrae TaxID=1312182 RepID=A0ABT7KES0_9HYPH|nr:hypothetical protein [Rhizobium calliandrae]MDL2405664.1 hypothetical protein [Rhizobium calliandrae]
MQVVEELKKKREELEAKIDALHGEIAVLEQQRAAFDTVLKVYDVRYRPDGAARIRPRKPPKVPASAVTPLLKDLDKRGALLRILRDAEAPVSTAHCAKQVALQKESVDRWHASWLTGPRKCLQMKPAIPRGKRYYVFFRVQFLGENPNTDPLAMDLYIESAYVKDVQVRFRRLAPFGRIVEEAVFGKQ